MPEIDIREVHAEEMHDILYRLTGYAFSSTPPFPDEEEFKRYRRLRQGTRVFAAFAGEERLACAGALYLNKNVRGKIYPAMGVYGVAVEPSARRKGLGRNLLTRLLAELRAEGSVFSDLYPFRESFYERLGYVTLPQARWVGFDTGPLASLLKRDLGGEVQRGLLSDHLEEYTQLQTLFQETAHGVSVFSEPDYPLAARNNRWLAVARVGGKMVGGMTYQMQIDSPATGTLKVHRFMPLNAQGRYLLLEWIARHIDQATHAELWLAADAYPETWLPDLQIKIQPGFLAPMGRVLDIAGLSAMPVGEGGFCVEIEDGICPWNAGVWTFRGNLGELEVYPGGQPQGKLSIQALSALVYGVNRAADFSYRGWGDPSPALQEQLDAVFPPKTPFLFEQF